MLFRRALPRIFFAALLSPFVCAALTSPMARAETAAQSVYDKVRPFIVVVRAAKGADSETHGSGVIIGANEIATNCHVVADAKTIAVFRAADDTPLAATLSRGDYGRDICILSVAGMHNAQTAAIRKSKTLKVGETVFAVGAPQGFDYTITDGIISQLRALGGSPPLIQTNAAISPGSSGGGLFDANGNLVGLTTFYHREGQNLNFAVPTEWLEEVGKKAAGEVAGKDEKAEIAAAVGFLNKVLELEKAEDWQGLLAHCRRWTDAEPWNVVAWFGLGVAYGNFDRYDDAIAAFREALRIDSEFAVAWYNLGVTYSKLSRYDDAIAAYREALRINPEYAVAWYNLGIAYDKLDRYDDTIAAYREALRIHPKHAFAWNNLGFVYNKLGRHDDAISALHEALRIDPEDAIAWHNLGFAYGKLGRYNDAVNAHRKALQVDPEYARAWTNLGIAYRNLDRHDDAIAAYREALRIDPENAIVLHNMGVAYRKIGHHDDEIAAYQEALRINPEYALAWNSLGVAYENISRIDDAIVAYREALRIDPEYALAWNNLGITYGNLGRHDEAAVAFRKALRVDPEYADAWNNLVIAYRAQGRHAEADEANQKHLRLKVLGGE